MFLDALKKGDVEEASRYVVVEKREKEKRFLDGEKKIDNLQLFLRQVSSSLKKEENNLGYVTKSYFFYEFKNSKGEIQNNSVVFSLNPYTKVWKISVL